MNLVATQHKAMDNLSLWIHFKGIMTQDLGKSLKRQCPEIFHFCLLKYDLHDLDLAKIFEFKPNYPPFSSLNLSKAFMPELLLNNFSLNARRSLFYLMLGKGSLFYLMFGKG